MDGISRGQRPRRTRVGVAAITAVALIATLGSAASAGAPGKVATAVPNSYTEHDLVSDVAGTPVTDANLVNPWGIAAGPSSPIWVSDNGTGKTTLYKNDPTGKLVAVPLVVSIPKGSPTGQVYNPSTSWVIKSGSSHAPALFIFASEAGAITGWNATVPPPSPSTKAQVGVTVRNAIYKGLAIATGPRGNWLYAANFHAGTIDVFDGNFRLLHWAGAFHDAMIPAGYAPFNIQNLGGRLYVTYAKQKPDHHDDLSGPGNGFVDVYNIRGTLQKRLVSHGVLNSPWGLAMAPTGFGPFAGALLVGNFGDGEINAFNATSGKFLGHLQRSGGAAIAISGLWALRFGNANAGSPTTLFFTAGISAEKHGLLGTITAP
jgi:uncharacterized protein (TIGR03118 family)